MQVGELSFSLLVALVRLFNLRAVAKVDVENVSRNKQADPPRLWMRNHKEPFLRYLTTKTDT